MKDLLPFSCNNCWVKVLDIAREPVWVWASISALTITGLCGGTWGWTGVISLLFLDALGRSNTLVQIEISQHLFDGLPWKFAQTLMVLRWWISLTLVILLMFPLAPSAGRLFQLIQWTRHRHSCSSEDESYWLFLLHKYDVSIWGLEWNISTNFGWIAIKFGADIVTALVTLYLFI